MSIFRNPYPYHICTAQQGRNLDERTIREFGIDGFTLMETAGFQAANFIGDREAAGSTGLFVCGKGNNAGDALVTARYLSMHFRHDCTIFSLEGEEDLSPDTARNLTLLKELARGGNRPARVDNRPEKGDNRPTISDNRIDFADDPDVLRDKQWDYIVDGMLGTGLNSDLKPLYASTVARINTQEIPVYSLDIPAGLNTDTGEVMGAAVRAGYTLSFGARKPGFYFEEGPACTGEIQQFNLSFPDHLKEVTATVILPEQFDQMERVRRQGARHKYRDGIVYIAAGSEGLTGAAIMAAQSAWKSGVGAVFLFSPRGLLPVYEKTLPEIIKIPVGAADSTRFSPDDAGAVLEALGKHEGTLLIGPGIGQKEETCDFTSLVLNGFTGQTVIDADAIAGIKDITKPAGAKWILTPHPGELSQLSGKQLTSGSERLDWIKEHVEENRVTFVSKGSPVIIGTESGEIYLTGYDTRIFSRAGFGDVLAGKIAGSFSISGNPEYSVIQCLLDGYTKAVAFTGTDNQTALEPGNLL